MGAFPLALADAGPERIWESMPVSAEPAALPCFQEPGLAPSSLFSPSAREPRKRTLQTNVPAVVVRVIDGDSLVVNVPSFPAIVGYKITVRIAGCDTPELRDKRPGIRALAQNARTLTASMAAPGSIVWLRDIRRDKYFRLLTRVETDNGDIGEELVRQGFAVPYEGGKKAAW